MTRYYGGLSKPPKQLIRRMETGKKPSNQQLAGARAKEHRDYEFLCMVVDDVSPAVRKMISSLDPEQGGLPATDISEPLIVEQVLQEFFKATYRHKITALRKKRYIVGSKLVNGKQVILHRSPTAMDIRSAVRFAVKELQYIRAEAIKDDPDQGIPMRRNVAAANAIAALRQKERIRLDRLNRLRSVKPLERPTLTAKYRRRKGGRLR